MVPVLIRVQPKPVPVILPAVMVVQRSAPAPVPDVQRGAPVPVEQLIFPVMQNTNYRAAVVLPVAQANTVPRGRTNVRPVRTSPQIHRIPGIRTQTIVRGLATVGTI